MGAFSKIGLVAHNNSELIQESFGRVIRCLQDQSVDVLVEAKTAEVLPAGDLQVLDTETLGQRCDLIIAVGGDGNILGTARAFAPQGVPVVGVLAGGISARIPSSIPVSKSSPPVQSSITRYMFLASSKVS